MTGDEMGQVAGQIKRAMGGYTQEQLAAAFGLVKDQAGWKNPVDAVVSADADLRAITIAVVHFTGSIPEIYPQMNGQELTGFHVVAAGYYYTIGS